MLVAEKKEIFLASNVVVAGLGLHFNYDDICTKVKDFKMEAQKLCHENNIKFIDNESPFKLKTGELDTSVVMGYVMHLFKYKGNSPTFEQY